MTAAGAARSLVGRVGGVAGSLVLGQVLVGLTYVVGARGTGPAGLGLVATAVAVGTVGSTVFDLGLTSWLVREVAAGRLTAARARALVRAKRRAVPLLLVPATVACLLIVTSPAEGLVLGAVGWAVWEAQTANGLLRADERFSRAASGQLAGRASGLAATLALLAVGPPGFALAVGLVLGFAAEAVLDRVALGPAGERAARPRELLAVQRRTLSFGLVSLAAVGQQLDTPLVTAGAGAAAGGVYAGAGRLLGPLLLLSSSLALVGGPSLARAQRDPVALRAEERRIGRFSAVLALGPLAAAGLGPVLIPWILGAEFAASGPTFAVLAVGAALSTLNQGMATVLQNRGAERTVGRAIGAGLIVGLTATAVLAVSAGPVLAAAGFAVSQLCILVRLAVGMRRTGRVRPARR